MNNYNQLCVWPGTIIGPDQINDFEEYMLDELNTRVKYECEVKTLPDLDDDGNDVEGTGGRNDAFFYVHDEDIQHFAIPRLKMGIRWWEDVIKYNNNSHLYTEEFLEKYPSKW